MHSIVQISITAATTLIAAFGGSFFAGSLQTDLWKRQAVYQLFTDTYNRRVAAFRELSAALSEAQLLKLYHGTQANEGTQPLVNILFCADSSNRLEDCKINMRDKQTADLAREVFALQSRFEAARAEANVFFCEKTRHALRQLPQGTWWWNASQEMRANLISRMETEITCELELVKILR